MKSVACLCLLVIAAACRADSTQPEREEHQGFQKYFEEANVKGCFLFYDLQKNKYIGYNLARTKTRFIPASTYKIFNSLVALETRAVSNETEIIKWNGVRREVPAWNQDQNMRTAIRNSTVWFYQELARRIGQQRMQHYVDLAGYGNRDISGGIDHFWLDGGLRISTEEQINLLVRLYRNELPFSQRTMDIVKDILINEKNDHYVLRAKTGWTQRVHPQIGWWVGYVEQNGGAYFFAINIDISASGDAVAREKVARKILRELNLLE